MKIGILTHYYNTKNYGGILQAYALVEFLRKNGFDAEQICYKFGGKPFHVEEKKLEQTAAPLEEAEMPISFFQRVKRSLRYRYGYYKLRKDEEYFKAYQEKYLKPRYDKFTEFQNQIPHSEKSYDAETISSADGYDCYITGSDQVWNFQWFNPAFFLDFVKAPKKKIAYAASAGKSSFTDAEKGYLEAVLPSFDAISVRESDLVDVLKEVKGAKSAEYVLDSTLLLRPEDWDKIATERLIEEKYAFCFFLGNDDEMKRLEAAYAKKHRLKLAIIPYDCGMNRLDAKFGNRRVDLAGPGDFVSLIKHAECVFTDSFHATVFSMQYQKEVFVFGRLGAQGMSSRIYSLTKLFGCEANFCDSEEKRTLAYIESLGKIDYSRSKNAFEQLHKESSKFLLNNLYEH